MLSVSSKKQKIKIIQPLPGSHRNSSFSTGDTGTSLKDSLSRRISKPGAFLAVQDNGQAAYSQTEPGSVHSRQINFARSARARRRTDEAAFKCSTERWLHVRISCKLITGRCINREVQTSITALWYRRRFQYHRRLPDIFWYVVPVKHFWTVLRLRVPNHL